MENKTCTNTRGRGNITCLWLKEITEAIHNVCPKSEKINDCDNINKMEKEQIWKDYQQSLEKNGCVNNDIVKRILNYEVDYNEFRK